MDTKIKWNDGEGYITATYEGSGDGSAIISSDVNEGIDRVQTLTVQTTNGLVEEKVLVLQEGLRQPFGLSGGGVFRIKGGGRYGVLKVRGITIYISNQLPISNRVLLKNI